MVNKFEKKYSKLTSRISISPKMTSKVLSNNETDDFVLVKCLETHRE